MGNRPKSPVLRDKLRDLNKPAPFPGQSTEFCSTARAAEDRRPLIPAVVSLGRRRLPDDVSRQEGLKEADRIAEERFLAIQISIT